MLASSWELTSNLSSSAALGATLVRQDNEGQRYRAKSFPVMRDSPGVADAKPRTDPTVQQHRIPAAECAEHGGHLGDGEAEG